MFSGDRAVSLLSTNWPSTKRSERTASFSYYNYLATDALRLLPSATFHNHDHIADPSFYRSGSGLPLATITRAMRIDSQCRTKRNARQRCLSADSVQMIAKVAAAKVNAAACSPIRPTIPSRCSLPMVPCTQRYLKDLGSLCDRHHCRWSACRCVCQSASCKKRTPRMESHLRRQWRSYKSHRSSPSPPSLAKWSTEVHSLFADSIAAVL